MKELVLRLRRGGHSYTHEERSTICRSAVRRYFNLDTKEVCVTIRRRAFKGSKRFKVSLSHYAGVWFCPKVSTWGVLHDHFADLLSEIVPRDSHKHVIYVNIGPMLTFPNVTITQEYCNREFNTNRPIIHDTSTNPQVG